MISRIVSFITKPRSADVEAAICICTGAGSIVGFIGGIRDASNHHNGYICRPLCHTMAGITIGFFGGLYYRYTMSALILYDFYDIYKTRK